MAADEITRDFLRRAIAESERYGEDPWVFLRELGQNSRDAHAAFIQIATRTEGRQASLLFEDDGLGMTLSHARAYLFRLYASSKSDDACAAGRFGVGFWSILRFGATRIEVHSRTLSESFGVVLSGDLSEWKDVRCRRDRQGTTILLVRPDGGVRPDDFDDQVHLSAIRYLAHLRTAGRRPRPLPVSLNGRSIERPFALKSPGELRFRDGAVEGVVGFGPRPHYKLYARGLPVMEGAFLDEIEGKPARTGSKAEREGVAPVFLLNGNNIDVVLSRETVVWNRALRELVRVARRRFDELVSRTIDGSTSTSSAGRLWTLFDSIVRSVGRGPIWMRTSAVVLGLLIVGGSLGLALSSVRGQREPLALGPGPVVAIPPETGVDSSELVLIAAHRPNSLIGMRTSTVVAATPAGNWDFRYSPPQSLLFRQYLLGRYDPHFGFQASEDGDDFRPAQPGPLDLAIEIELNLHGQGGAFILPVPTGMLPVGQSASLGSRSVPIEVDGRGLARTVVPSGVAEPLRYRVIPAKQTECPESMATSPPISLPVRIFEMLHPARSGSSDQRIQAAIALTHRLLLYDQSPKTAAAFARALNSRGNWVENILAIGAGDCDVINGFLALVILELGVPARLVAGIAGQEGRSLPGWHAWVEVLEGGQLKVVDATVGAQRMNDVPAASGTVAADPSAPRPVPPPFTPTLQRTQTLHSRAVWFGFGLGLAAVAFGLLLAVLGLRQSGQLQVTADSTLRRELLAGMAVDALRRPKAWRGVNGIWHRRFLPCLDGRTISLARLTRLCRAERAFIGRTGSELADIALRSKAVVLASDDPHFGALFARTANLRDLDELARFKPLWTTSRPTRSLLRAIDRVLTAGGVSAVCRAVAVEEQRLCWDIDLRPIRTGRDSGWPERFLAVNPAHPFWRSLEELWRRAPGPALAMAVDRLSVSSTILAARAPVLRRIAARAVLREQA